MTLADQVNTIERALGERMLRHAFAILRTWVHELGLSFYMDRIQTIEENYDQVFDYFLAVVFLSLSILLHKFLFVRIRVKNFTNKVQNFEQIKLWRIKLNKILHQ